jgi:ssDNA-binding Zn-finger/Zn-ribbon topoisomerase 1
MGVRLVPPADLKCPECGAKMQRRDSKYGLFYGCSRYPECKSTHGCHPDGRPLGIPANKATKLARIKAHDAFDWLWKEGGFRRRQAYAWMQHRLGLTADEAHIGRFDVAMCERLVEAVENHKHGDPDPRWRDSEQRRSA